MLAISRDGVMMSIAASREDAAAAATLLLLVVALLVAVLPPTPVDAARDVGGNGGGVLTAATAAAVDGDAVVAAPGVTAPLRALPSPRVGVDTTSAAAAATRWLSAAAAAALLAGCRARGGVTRDGSRGGVRPRWMRGGDRIARRDMDSSSTPLMNTTASSSSSSSSSSWTLQSHTPRSMNCGTPALSADALMDRCVDTTLGSAPAAPPPPPRAEADALPSYTSSPSLSNEESMSHMRTGGWRLLGAA
jgi:hypothetical protein